MIRWRPSLVLISLPGDWGVGPADLEALCSEACNWVEHSLSHVYWQERGCRSGRGCPPQNAAPGSLEGGGDLGQGCPLSREFQSNLHGGLWGRPGDSFPHHMGLKVFTWPQAAGLASFLPGVEVEAGSPAGRRLGVGRKEHSGIL